MINTMGNMGLGFVLEFTCELNCFPHFTRIADFSMSLEHQSVGLGRVLC